MRTPPFSLLAATAFVAICTSISAQGPAQARLLLQKTGNAAEKFGQGFLVIPDQDGDGQKDIAVGSPRHNADRGLVQSFSGTSQQLLSQFSGIYQFGGLGAHLDAGDFDSDGIIEILAGADWTFWPSNGTTECVILRCNNLLPVWRKTGGGESFFGRNMQVLPDMDGDGLGEVYVSDAENNCAGTDSGAAFVFSSNGTTRWSVCASGAWDRWGRFGSCLLQDISGDGLPEIAIPALETNPIAGPGYVRVLSGSNGSVLWNSAGSTVSSEMLHVVPAGEVQGDGTLDLAALEIVSASVSNIRLLSGTDGALIQSVSVTRAYHLSYGTDINGDGAMELAIASTDASGITQVDLYDSLNRSIAASWQPQSLGNHRIDSLRWTTDFDADGWPDVELGSAGAGLVQIYSVRSLLAFGPQDTVAASLYSSSSTVAGLTAHAASELPTGGVILFGGNSVTGPSAQTYTLSGTNWTLRSSPVNPAPRTDHSLLLDSARQNNLLFGGKTSLGTPLADTWTWANNQWTLLSTPTAPPARSGHRMAFDRSANLGLLFGGEDVTGTARNDFWSWDGTNWAQVTPATLPPARARHGMAFDALRNRTIVHGGKNGTSRLDDVWEWDGAQWSEASAAVRPSERHGTALVHDTARNRLVLHGGRDNARFLTDTWELNNNPGPLNPGLAWSRVATNQAPSPRNSFSMAHDPVRNRTVLFGGYDGSRMIGETWTFDGTNWTQQSPTNSPADRSSAGFTFDSARGVAVLFGGFNSTLFQLNDTWEWNGSSWTQRTTSISPPGRMFAPIAYDSARQRSVLFGGLASNGNLGDTWEFDGTNWAQVSPATSPSARYGVMLCYDPLRNQTVMFGGTTTAGVLNETWTFDGTNWTQRSPLNAPPARLQGEMVFDPARGKVVLFGGGSTGWATNYSDTWEWDGTNWAPANLRRAGGNWNPGARDGHAMAYDPRSELVVLHGGETAAGCQQDIWSWNGAEWTIHIAQSGSVPSARTGSQLFHDSGTNRLLLFAGGCGTNYTNDLWELSLPTFARTSSYGTPCVGSRGPLTLSVLNNSLPIIGQTFRMEMSNVPLFSPCAGYLGFSNTLFNGVPLPFALDFLSMPGCMAYMSANHNFPLGLPNNVLNTTAWDLAIPMDPVFLSLHIYMQGLALEFGGTRFATVTNGIDARIGDR